MAIMSYRNALGWRSYPYSPNLLEERFSEIRAKLEPVASCLWRKGLEPASALKREEGGGQNMPLYMTQVGYTSDRKSTRLNSSHANISYAVFCLKKKTVSSSILESSDK